MACRRNNKDEKRIRSLRYARIHRRKSVLTQRQAVREMKRQIVATNNDKFQQDVFTMTTDDDYPPYTEFEFLGQ